MTHDTLNLFKLTSEILRGFSVLAARRRSHFINNIPPNLVIDADIELLSSILSSLLSAVLRHASSSSILVSAKNYKSGIVLLHVRNCHISNAAEMEEELSRLQKLAERMGGYIGMGGRRNELTTLSFSFPSLQLAA